ncbi:hypothetical protein ACTPOK_05070 [Streptomyces inhibens]|uniref:hypothetical protein n=1 Tax=Streptomyces inhibens TaxID=2293571 RepID=UPI00402AD447
MTAPLPRPEWGAFPWFLPGLSDRHTALSAGVAVGCGGLAFAATAVVGLPVMYGRELVKREGRAAARRARRDPSPVT